MNLTNKKVLVTGGTSGLGLSLTKNFQTKGAHVVAIAKSPSEDRNITAYQVDITDRVAIKKFIEAQGPFDILVNNAGLWLEGPVEDNDPLRVKEVIDTNFTGLVYMTQSIIPEMKAQGTGYIVNISSTSGIKPRGDNQAVYSASK